MKNVLVSLQKRFIKPTYFEGKTAKELMKIDAADKENQLEMRYIDFGVEVKQQVSWSMELTPWVKFIVLADLCRNMLYVGIPEM